MKNQEQDKKTSLTIFTLNKLNFFKDFYYLIFQKPDLVIQRLIDWQQVIDLVHGAEKKKKVLKYTKSRLMWSLFATSKAITLTEW